MRDHSLVSQADVSAGTIRVFINTVPIGVLVGPAGTSAAFHSDVSPLSPVVRASLPATRTGTLCQNNNKVAHLLGTLLQECIRTQLVCVVHVCASCFRVRARLCVRNWRLVLVCVCFIVNVRVHSCCSCFRVCICACV
jgi:hypothetical protein